MNTDKLSHVQQIRLAATWIVLERNDFTPYQAREAFQVVDMITKYITEGRMPQGPDDAVFH